MVRHALGRPRDAQVARPARICNASIYRAGAAGAGPELSWATRRKIAVWLLSIGLVAFVAMLAAPIVMPLLAQSGVKRCPHSCLLVAQNGPEWSPAQ